MIEFGMILTPEDLRIPRDPNNESPAEPRQCFTQARACFTMMHRDELSVPREATFAGKPTVSHMEQFGTFSIGLDPIRARALGVVPVMYFYRAAFSENISFEILFRLRELRTLLSALAHIEARAAPPDREIFDVEMLHRVGHDLGDQPEIRRRIMAATEAELRLTCGLLDTDRLPAWNLVDWVDIFLSFFQVTDSQTRPDSLAYYQQREWRIVKLFGDHIQCFGLAEASPTPDSYPDDARVDLRRWLQGIDDRFFTAERLNKSYVLCGTHSEQFFDFIDEIIVPREAKQGTGALLEYYFPNQFRATNLPSSIVSFERMRR